MAKITYVDKVKVKDIAVPEINKFTEANANEIKTVVNGLDDSIYNLETGNEKKPIVSVIWKTGLTFDVIATQFPILNQWEEATPGEVVLEPSDPLLDRIDLIGAFAPVSPATLGLVGKITGDPASTELVVPPDYDPQFFYPIKPVTVKAGATTPTDGSGNTMGTELVYANGTGEPDEWTFSSNSASIINSGGVINATNPALKNKATMTNNADVAGLNSDKNFSLSFDLTLKASMGNSYVVINLLASDGRTMSNSLLFRNGDYGFNSSSLEKQTIVINGLDFSFIILGSFRQLQIAPYKSFAGYTLDNIKFHIGSATLPNPNYHTHSNLPFLETLNQEKFDLKLDDTDALTAVTPTNKLITQDDIAGLGGGDMLKSTYDPTNVNGDAFASDLMKNATVAKTTPIDADNLTLWDSVSSSFKKVTWANTKATLKTYFDTLFISGSGTQYYLPKFGVGGKVLENSLAYESGGLRYITGVPTTEDVSYGIGSGMSNGNSTFFGWRYNAGTPFGFITTYADAANFNINPDGGVGNVGFGHKLPTEKVHAIGNGKFTGSVQVGDNTAVASASNVGAIRYRVSGNNSYAEMCMQNGAASYIWETLTVHSW